jgi:hypothetical protein
VVALFREYKRLGETSGSDARRMFTKPSSQKTYGSLLIVHLPDSLKSLCKFLCRKFYAQKRRDLPDIKVHDRMT